MMNMQSELDLTPTPREVDFMASVLEGRHGLWAADVADFFSSLHGERGDQGRSGAWAGVAKTVRQRERHRLTAAPAGQAD